MNWAYQNKNLYRDSRDSFSPGCRCRGRNFLEIFKRSGYTPNTTFVSIIGLISMILNSNLKT